MNTNRFDNITRRTGERSPMLLRAIRGSALGLSDARRGTALVIILGALALISVITIVYVTLGQADRRSASVVVRQENVKGTVDRVRDYLAQVIADDTFTVYVNGRKPDPTNTNLNAPSVVSLVRPHATYPFTDPWRRSTLIPITDNAVSPDKQWHKFNPTGSYVEDVPSTFTGPGNVDSRLPSTPFLASTTPIWMRQGTLRQDEYLYQRDWMQISCVAPDGRYVNLWNLAPVINSGSGPVRVSGFDATSGIPINAGTDFPVNTAKFDRPKLALDGSIDLNTSWMSWGLTLMNFETDPKTNRPVSQRAGDPQYRFDPLHSDPNSNTLTGVLADPNIPAHWSMYQLNAIRPMQDFDFGPDAPEYTPYQWADVDGDGFPDARWFEPVDASDPNHVISLLPNDGQFRWFVAARITDLSALANVNISTDFLRPARAAKLPGGGASPLQATPIGFSPADIDLRRLLTLEDPTYRFGPVLPSVNGSVYQLLMQPLSPGGPADYRNMTGADANAMASLGYAALRDVLQAGAAGVPQSNVTYAPVTGFTGDERTRYFRNLVRRADGTFNVSTVQGNGQFGNADLLELLTYRTANNPDVTSRLEQVVDGRYNTFNGGRVATAGYGPLRSNRDLELETMVRENKAPTSPADYNVAEEAMARLAFDVRQYLTTINGSRPLRAGPILSTNVGRLDKSEVRINPIDALDAATQTDQSKRDPSLLFHGYADALAPYSGLRGAWDIPAGTAEGTTTSPGTGNPRDVSREATATLHYGGNRGAIGRWGPELAVRLAAHMTANMIAAYEVETDGTYTPNAYTLLLDNMADVANPAKATDPDLIAKFPWWFEKPATGYAPPNRLDLDVERLAHPDLAPGGGAVTTAARNGAINIFGIKPQPFLVQASSFCLYKTHFDEETNDDPSTTPLRITGAVPEGAGVTSSTNGDYLGQIIAFQLYNPFDTPVRLTGPSSATGGSGGNGNGGDGETGGGGSGVGNAGNFASGDWSDYYIEYNGYLFKLASFDDGYPNGGTEGTSTVTLGSRETRVFYALSIDRAQMEARLDMPGSNWVQRIVNAQFRVTDNGNTYDPIQIPRIKVPSTTSTMFSALRDGDAVDFFKDKAADATASNAAKKRVLLWRTMGSSQAPFNDADPGTQKLRRASNDRRNDLLADVLDEEAGQTTTGDRSSLDRRLDSGNNKVASSTKADAENGVSFAFHGTIKRHDDPTAAKRSIPGFLVEPKRGWKVAPGFANIGGTDKATISAGGKITGGDLFPSTVGVSKYPGRKGSPTGTNSVVEALTTGANSTGSPDFTILGMTDAAHSKNVSTKDGVQDRITSTPNLDTRPFDAVRIELPPYQAVGTAGGATPNSNPYIRTVTVNGVQTNVNTLRVVDLASVLAIGPEFDPSSATGVPDEQLNDPDHWITLSQSFALATNFISPGDTPTSSNPPLAASDADFTIYASLGDFRELRTSSDDAAYIPEPSGALDRGHLVLDRFAPFEDQNGNGVFDTGDVKRFPGVPLALNIFNIFDTRTATSIDPNTKALMPSASGLTTMVPGLININTAPLSVLRLIPLLSPTTEPNTWDQWKTQAGIPLTANDTFLGQANDIAASVFAYREKISMRARQPLAQTALTNNTRVTFDQYQPQATWTADERIDAFDMLNGRRITTGIGGIREIPGFSIPGEILAIVDRGQRRPFAVTRGLNKDNPSGRGVTRIPAAQQIDVLAYDSFQRRGTFFGPDAQFSGYPGVNTPIYPNTGTGDVQVTDLKDSWSEKLIAATGALGTTSTRSDVFAVWFIVQGYQRSDTEKLRPADVITPSVAKRFVMVVDRSNVVNKGQKPKIVLFTEVPMPER